MKKFLIATLCLGTISGFAQDDWSDDEWGDEGDSDLPIHAFNDTRVINGHSAEVLNARTLDMRITHRFGNIGTQGSGRTLFGLDNSTDIRIAFEYGITDELTVGFGRSKGAGPYKEFWDGLAKYKILQQSSTTPLTLSVALSGFYTSMAADPSITSPVGFDKSAHRFSYYSQIVASRAFGDRVSVMIAPGYSHRNLVAYEDENGLISVGAGFKYRFLKKMSLIAEYYHVLRSGDPVLGVDYYNPLGFGVEIKTHAHIFQLNFMNSSGIGEGQFIPYTSSNWSDGEFRFGFTIARQF